MTKNQLQQQNRVGNIYALGAVLLSVFCTYLLPFIPLPSWIGKFSIFRSQLLLNDNYFNNPTASSSSSDLSRNDASQMQEIKCFLNENRLNQEVYDTPKFPLEKCNIRKIHLKGGLDRDSDYYRKLMVPYDEPVIFVFDDSYTTNMSNFIHYDDHDPFGRFSYQVQDTRSHSKNQENTGTREIQKILSHLGKEKYSGKKNSYSNYLFNNMTRLSSLYEKFGNLHVTLSSSNSFSYDRKDSILSEYLCNIQKEVLTRKKNSLNLNEFSNFTNGDPNIKSFVMGDVEKEEIYDEDIYIRYCEIDRQNDDFHGHPEGSSDNKIHKLPSNETFYLFGTHHGAAWAAFLAPYQYPPCNICFDEDYEQWYDMNEDDFQNLNLETENDPDDQELEEISKEIKRGNNKYKIGNDKVALSFGIGRKYSGVSFHLHGPGYSEVLHGQKRWYLYNPDDISKHNMRNPPFFHPNKTTYEWASEYYEYLSECKNGERKNHKLKYIDPFMVKTNNIERSEKNENRYVNRHGETSLHSSEEKINPSVGCGLDLPPLYECTISKNEILYFPHMYYHAILNVDDYNVFVSTFL